MEWLLIESLLAFVILVVIVAWTMAPLRKRRPPSAEPRKHGVPPPND